jgi:hypothetical protein
LDLDPAVNPDAGYTLALEVENLTGPPVEFNDGCGENGGTVCGPSSPQDVFSTASAIVSYLPQQAFLSPNLPHSATLAATGQVYPSSTGVIVVQTLSAEVIAALQQNLSSQAPGSAGDVILQVSLEGTLSNGQAQTSTALSFPLHVCFDCGVRPLSCLDGVTAAPSGDGPCCLAQDVSEACVPCGGAGEACCALPDGVPLPCAQASDCLAFGLGLTPPDGGATDDCFIEPGAQAGTCVCWDDADCQTFYGASSVCTRGACTPGCNADATGKPLACTVATTLPPGAEDCGYPNSGAITQVCASP